MEFFAGVLFTFILISTVRFLFLRSDIDSRYASTRIIYTQSHVHSLVSSKIASLIMPPEPPKTQSRDLLSKNQIRVVFADNQAYWIKDSIFYQADVINGEIDNSTTKIVDTMAMDKVELDKMFFIVQKLTEGKQNDGGNPGVKGL